MMATLHSATLKYSGRDRRMRSESLISTLAIAVLAVIAFACAAMLVPILWTAVTEGQPTPACDAVKISQRQACLEAQGAAPGHPAKGANAPLGTGGRQE
jgi:hypothetical protein